MLSEQDIKKMYWHSRRGMLELDLILLPFVTEHLAALNEEQQELYRELLREEDQDLFAWLVHGAEPPSESLKRMVETILATRSK